MLYAVKSILYASDLSPKSPTVFRHAVGLAQRFQAQLHALTVLRPGMKIPDELFGDDTEDLPFEIDKQGEELLNRRIKTFDLAHPEYEVYKYLASARAVEGDPAKMILEEATEIKADMIVMGSRGHSVIDELLLGSVAHKITMRATIPVVLVPFDRN
jgi:nucleotide-binding universal stress UspA family protein